MIKRNNEWSSRLSEGIACLVTLVVAAMTASGAAAQSTRADPQNGERLFAQRCALCHQNGSGGAGQGPNLGGIADREAAADGSFSYTAALRAAGLVWDAATLDRFLAAPMRVVPGTSMPINVPNEVERRDVVAYLGTLTDTSVQSRGDERQGPLPGAGSGYALAAVGAAGVFADWRADSAGAVRHITPDDLPGPFASPSVRSTAAIVARSASNEPRVPDGFTVREFASGLEGPRVVRVAPNGDIFVAETRAGRIRVLRADDGAERPTTTAIFAADLDQPFGIALHPASDPRWVYVANINSVVRFPYRAGDLEARGPAEVVVPQLSESTAGHSTRDIAFSNDGARMFVSVGSASNVAEDLPEMTRDQIHAWEAQHGRGAAWGYESRRADVLVFDPDGRNGRIFATGIRNCVGLGVHPATDDLWCATNERDGLGDNLVPDYATRVREGAFYGWPWYYIGGTEDPRHHGARPDLADDVAVPDVLFQPHSAPLGLTFYGPPAGVAGFPPEYVGDAFVAFHGSWNRSARTGYKVVRVPMENGVPTGEYEDFLVGFVADDQQVWGRPVGVAVAHDGALIVSEDGNGTLWRIAYDRTRVPNDVRLSSAPGSGRF